jgi:hypothetical protein
VFVSGGKARIFNDQADEQKRNASAADRRKPGALYPAYVESRDIWTFKASIAAATPPGRPLPSGQRRASVSSFSSSAPSSMMEPLLSQLNPPLSKGTLHVVQKLDHSEVVVRIK